MAMEPNPTPPVELTEDGWVATCPPCLGTWTSNAYPPTRCEWKETPTGNLGFAYLEFHDHWNKEHKRLPRR